MMHRAWSSIVEVPYCFWRSSIKFQGHTALKIVEFDPNWAFPDWNSKLNSPMAMKCCTKLETAKERCPIVFQGHPSNFKVTRYKTSLILTQIGHFRTIGQSQLSNPSDLPCYTFLYKLMFEFLKSLIRTGNFFGLVLNTEWHILILQRNINYVTSSNIFTPSVQIYLYIYIIVDIFNTVRDNIFTIQRTLLRKLHGLFSISNTRHVQV